MKKLAHSIFRLSSTVIFALVIMALPVSTSAATGSNNPAEAASGGNGSGTAATGNTNPSKTDRSYFIDAFDPGASGAKGTEGKIKGLVDSAVNLLFFAAGAAAVIFLAYGGVSYITSGGDETKTASARKTMINAFIGVVLVSLTYTIFIAAINLGSRIASNQVNQNTDN